MSASHFGHNTAAGAALDNARGSARCTKMHVEVHEVSFRTAPQTICCKSIFEGSGQKPREAAQSRWSQKEVRHRNVIDHPISFQNKRPCVDLQDSSNRQA